MFDRHFFSRIVLVCSMGLAVSGAAAVRGTDVLVPVGADLRAGVSITNPSATDAVRVRIELVGAAASPIDVSLAPEQTTVYDNVAESLGAIGIRGAVRVHADRDVLVSSRVAIRREKEPLWRTRSFHSVHERSGLERGSVATLDGLQSSAEFRYEVLLFETSGAGVTVRVALHDGRGMVMGERLVTLAPYEQRALISSDIAGMTTIPEGSVRLEVTDGDGRAVAHGSLVGDAQEEVADFAMNVSMSPTVAAMPGRGGIAHREAQAKQLRVFTPNSFSFAGTSQTSSNAANRRIVPQTNAFLGAAQLMKSDASSLLHLQSNGNATYFIRGAINSDSVPGVPFLLGQPELFQVRTDGGFVLKSFNTNMAGAEGSIPASNYGTRLMWWPYKAAFRAGTVPSGAPHYWDPEYIGFYSWAGGLQTMALGLASFAVGQNNVATGSHAVVMGIDSLASGPSAFAMGLDTESLGDQSVAMGFRVAACGLGSVVLGSNASSAQEGFDGNQCLGTDYTGTFIFGDASTGNYVTAVANNEFVARAHGGFRFRSSANLSTGCNLPAGSGVFSCTSDRNLKNDFATLDGEDVLRKLSDMPIDTWSFIGEEGVRHAGPSAQDFHAAFRLGTDDTSIGLTDINGVALKGVQALEARTRDLRAEVENKTKELETAKAEIAELRGRLEKLEALLTSSR